MLITLSIIVFLIVSKTIWVMYATSGHGTYVGEKKELIRRANYLISKVATTPQKLLDEIPSAIGTQFQGEWAFPAFCAP